MTINFYDKSTGRHRHAKCKGNVGELWWVVEQIASVLPNKEKFIWIWIRIKWKLDRIKNNNKE